MTVVEESLFRDLLLGHTALRIYRLLIYSVRCGATLGGRMGSRCAVCFSCFAVLFLTSSWTFAANAPTISLSVDASAAPRKLIHAQLRIPASPGTLTLYYPKWIPGEHGPTGPVQDLTGLKFAASGKALKWRRDLLDGWTFHVEVPAGESEVTADLDYASPATLQGG